MRVFFSFLFMIVLMILILLSACAWSSPEPLIEVTPAPAATKPPNPPTQTSPPPTPTATAEPTASDATPTSPTTFAIQQGASFPSNRPLIAFESEKEQRKILFLADPAENIAYELHFPAGVHFAMPFLAGLSPDARYFVVFEGGWLETLYEYQHLRASKPDVVLHVLDLRSGKTIFSTSLLSSSYPQDLIPVAETIKDDWTFTHSNIAFEDIVASTQEFLLDNIRRIAWSPDGSLLAYASQDPGPTSDLYLLDVEKGTTQPLFMESKHVNRVVWAPDSAHLILDTSLFDRHAREDTTYLLSREGSVVNSFTSQIRFFHHWHDPVHAIIYGATDAGDPFEPQAISAIDGTTTMLWGWSFSNIAFSPDLSTFLFSSYFAEIPHPPHPGLFLGNRGDGSLQSLSDVRIWNVAYWGSDLYLFAASSIEEGTVGVKPGEAPVTLDPGYWKLTSAPNHQYLAGYNFRHPRSIEGVLPGLRIFDANGKIIESNAEENITCVQWDAASSALAYQSESRLYLWDAASGSTRLVSDQLYAEECAFQWVQENP